MVLATACTASLRRTESRTANPFAVIRAVSCALDGARTEGEVEVWQRAVAIARETIARAFSSKSLPWRYDRG